LGVGREADCTPQKADVEETSERTDKQKTIWPIRKGYGFSYMEHPNNVQNWSTNILAMTTKTLQLDKQHYSKQGDGGRT
jgi:hypothetical protein